MQTMEETNLADFCAREALMKSAEAQAANNSANASAANAAATAAMSAAIQRHTAAADLHAAAQSQLAECESKTANAKKLMDDTAAKEHAAHTAREAALKAREDALTTRESAPVLGLPNLATAGARVDLAYFTVCQAFFLFFVQEVCFTCLCHMMYGCFSTKHVKIQRGRASRANLGVRQQSEHIKKKLICWLLY